MSINSGKLSRREFISRSNVLTAGMAAMGPVAFAGEKRMNSRELQMNTPDYLVIKNGTILTPRQQVNDGIVIIRGSKIYDVGNRGEVKEPPGVRVIDAGGNYILPGMLDIHVNGANGADFTKVDSSTFDVAGSFFAEHGVTSYLATAITAIDEDFLKGLDSVRSYITNNKSSLPELLGMHMEGPYLNPNQKGAHPVELITLPKPSHYKKFLEYDDVLKTMTFAPELEGAAQLARDLTDRGIIAVAGHTDGIYSEMIDAINAGITHVTHFFCNMSNFRRDNLKRVAGAAETLLYDDRVTGELIADGWHLGPTLMNLLVKVKGVDRVCLVTDAMPATGLPDGICTIAGVTAIKENGIARLPDNSAYAGSVTTMDVCLKTAVNYMGQTFQDAVQMSTLTPARIIKVDDRKGSIEKNKDADIIIMDEDFKVLTTIVRGVPVYQTER